MYMHWFYLQNQGTILNTFTSSRETKITLSFVYPHWFYLQNHGAISNRWEQIVLIFELVEQNK